MNKVKRFAVIALAGLLMVLMSACGGRRSGNGAYYAADSAKAEEAAEYDARQTEPAYAGDFSEGSYSFSDMAKNGNVKLIFTADVSMNTKDLNLTISKIEELVNSFGGYIESCTVGTSYADFTVRVASEEFDSFLARMKTDSEGTISSVSRNVQDVGAQYSDIEGRLETLRIKQERLQDLLSRAEDMADIIELENALSDVEYEINRYTTEKNNYDSLIGYSTIRIYISERAVTPATSESTFGERIGIAFENGIENLKNGAQNFVIFLAATWHGWVIFIVIVIVVVKVIKYLVKKAAARPRPERQYREPSMQQQRRMDRRQQQEFRRQNRMTARRGGAQGDARGEDGGNMTADAGTQTEDKDQNCQQDNNIVQ